jgi:hypothetical protein
MSNSNSMPGFASMGPMPVVSIDRMRHLVPKPVRTRLGVGEAFIDHAAGAPLESRRASAPPLAPAMILAASAPPASSPALNMMNAFHGAGARENVYDPRTQEENVLGQSAAPVQFWSTDDPVELPLRSPRTTYVVVAALIAAFVAVLLSVVFAGGSRASSAATETPEAIQPSSAEK